MEIDHHITEHWGDFEKLERALKQDSDKSFSEVVKEHPGILKIIGQ